MRIRVTNAVLGVGSTGVITESIPIEFDPAEYMIQIHPSGHLVIELPDQIVGFIKLNDFENSVNSGSIMIHS